MYPHHTHVPTPHTCTHTTHSPYTSHVLSPCHLLFWEHVKQSNSQYIWPSTDCFWYTLILSSKILEITGLTQTLYLECSWSHTHIPWQFKAGLLEQHWQHPLLCIMTSVHAQSTVWVNRSFSEVELTFHSQQKSAIKTWNLSRLKHDLFIRNHHLSYWWEIIY